jgi:hypothetical protein
VKLDRIRDGIRVSDNGFAFRELESIGAERSFPLTAKSIADSNDLSVNRRVVFADVSEDQILRANCDVSMASWLIADRIYDRVGEQEEAEIEDYLRDRLVTVFGRGCLSDNHKIKGHSTSEWDVSAVVELPDHVAVFHAVSAYANSIFKASTAFHDIALLEKPPSLVAVVRSKKALGPRLDLLAQASGRVIEEAQADDVYKRAAA